MKSYSVERTESGVILTVNGTHKFKLPFAAALLLADALLHPSVEDLRGKKPETPEGEG